MNKFTDTVGREWVLSVNVASLKRVRSLVGVDILDIEGGVLDQIASDPVSLCDILYAICQPAATAANVSDIEFGESLSGDVLEAATESLLKAIADFFPKPKRDAIHDLLRRTKMIGEKLTAEAEAKLATLTDEMLETGMRTRIFGESSTSTPESSE